MPLIALHLPHKLEAYSADQTIKCTIVFLRRRSTDTFGDLTPTTLITQQLHPMQRAARRTVGAKKTSPQNVPILLLL